MRADFLILPPARDKRDAPCRGCLLMQALEQGQRIGPFTAPPAPSYASRRHAPIMALRS
jgi:hypothetical protein